MNDIFTRLHARALGSSLLLRPKAPFRFAPDQAAFDPLSAATMTMLSRPADAGPRLPTPLSEAAPQARPPDGLGRGHDAPPPEDSAPPGDGAPHTAWSGLSSPSQPERRGPDARLTGTASKAVLRDGSEGREGPHRAGRPPVGPPPASGPAGIAGASAAGSSPERASDRSPAPPEMAARPRSEKPGSALAAGAAGDIVLPAEAGARLPHQPEATPRPTAARPDAPYMAGGPVAPSGIIASTTAAPTAGADGPTPLRTAISATPRAETGPDAPKRHPGGSGERAAAVDPTPLAFLADEVPGRSAPAARPRPPIRETTPDLAVRVDIARIEVALPAPAPPAVRSRPPPPPLMLKPRRAQVP
jgi:hypothetical protein